MSIALSAEIKQLVDRANFAHLATLMPDGSPQSVPVWVGRDGDRVLVSTGEASLKARNTLRDPRVALSIVDFRDPYMEAQLAVASSSAAPIRRCAGWTRTRASTPASRFRFGSRPAASSW
jgi:PPOX class probable F420-dependent enzyme